MRRRALMAAALIGALAAAGDAGAGGPAGLSVRGRFSGGERGDSTFLIVDATPPDARVYLDGRLLGVAGELVAHALPVSYGPHAVHVIAPGFRPWATRVVVDGTFPVRVRATLSRD